MCKTLILLFCLLAICIQTTFSQQVSYVRSWTARVPQTDDKNILVTSPVDSVLMNTQYLDGLGRPLETVSKQLSPLGVDVVSVFQYDSMGREKYQFMPFVANSTGGNTSLADGLYKTNPFQQQPVFYNTLLTGQAESSFFALNVYESSPLNRVRESYAPGKNWAGTASALVEANRHGVDLRYGSNTTDDSVLRWQVTVGAIGTFSTYSAAYYGTAQLTKFISEDEQGSQTIEFKDKDGRVVLKKILLTANRDLVTGSHGHVGWLNTYYMYDDLGNLRCVLQPEGLNLYRSSPGTGALTDTAILNQQCFRYEYDARRRLIIKKVPGAYKSEMVYDKRDRVIMSRDSSLAKQGYWLVNKYDSLNRLVKIGLPANAVSRASHQTNSDADLTFSYPTLNVADVMQENYYDNYLWITASPQPGIVRTLTTTDITGAFFFTTFNLAPEYAQDVAADTLNVKGLVTGSKVRILGTSTYQYSVNFYDVKGRLIQTRGGNMASGFDIVTTQYDFSGKPLRVLHRQDKNTAPARIIRELTKYTYDHAGRVITVKMKVGASGTDVLLATNSYDEMGRLKTKVLGTNSETQDFEYNIRGWTIGMNRNSINASNRKFGYELGYDNAPTIVAGSSYAPKYNGNISGVIWKSAGSWPRAYDFQYDAAQRMTAANFTQLTGGVFNKSAGIDFSVSGLRYDANGNIQAMRQMGWKHNGSSFVDQLAYNYLPKTNKLARVTDTINDATTKLGDFKDGVNVGDDYAYDVNGNLTLDNNKGIGTILYTHQNLPYEIRIPGKGKITYTYDNLGTKWKKIVVDSTTTPNPTTTTWLYMNNVVYKNDTLQFFTHQEGRARYDTTQTTTDATAFNYDYFIKDHLGNIRMVLTEEKDTVRYMPSLGFEGSPGSQQVADQNRIWDDKTGASINVTSSRTIRPGNFGDTVSNGKYVILARKSLGAIAAGKLIKVMAGDRIHVSVECFYTTANANNAGASGINSLTTNLASVLAASSQVGTDLKDAGSSIVTPLASLTTLINILNTPNNTSGANQAPKAYLNVLAFDDQFRYDYSSSQVIPVPYGPNQVSTISRLAGSAVTMNSSGYVYIYCSNESDEMVYFDNLMLTHEKGPILEETHYYPFGLTMAGISSKALLKTENKKKFQGQEFNNDLDINYYEFKYRFHDPQTGRFVQIDPLADKYVHNSTYAFSENKITSHVELEGLEAWSIKNDENGDTKVYGPYRNQSSAQTAYNSDYSTKGGKQFINSEGMIVGNRVTENRIAKLEKGDISPNLEGVILHRTVSSSSESTLSSFRNRGVGTHFLVGKDGKVYQTASLNSKTSHLRESQLTNDKLSNATAIGIEVVGNYDESNKKWDAVTANQGAAVAGLVNSLLQTFNLTNANIFNHEEIQPKTKGEGRVVFDSISKYLNNSSTPTNSPDELPIPLTTF